MASAWDWKTFLAPLQYCYDLESASRSVAYKYEGSQSLVGRFSKKLDQQHSDKMREKEEEVDEAKNQLQSAGDFEENWKKYERALKIKSDRECSGSTWTIKMLENYIKREDIDFIQPEFRDLKEKAFLKMIHERVSLSIEAIGGGKGNVKYLANHTESDIRKILDAILDPLCLYKGLTVRTEETLKCDLLPTNKYDYIMYYNDQPIGVVEAKRKGCLKDQSVAQLLVQLLLLSAEAPDLFYFGVLSDANRFIFAGVNTNKVVFFQTNEDRLEIASINSPDDLKSIVGKISWLIEWAIQSRETEQSIEEMHNPSMWCLIF